MSALAYFTAGFASCWLTAGVLAFRFTRRTRPWKPIKPLPVIALGLYAMVYLLHDAYQHLRRR